jgi:hypothetical protein
LNRHLARESSIGNPTSSGTPAAVVGVRVERSDMTTHQAQLVKLTVPGPTRFGTFCGFSSAMAPERSSRPFKPGRRFERERRELSSGRILPVPVGNVHRFQTDGKFHLSQGYEHHTLFCVWMEEA